MHIRAFDQRFMLALVTAESLASRGVRFEPAQVLESFGHASQNFEATEDGHPAVSRASCDKHLAPTCGVSDKAQPIATHCNAACDEMRQNAADCDGMVGVRGFLASLRCPWIFG